MYDAALRGSDGGRQLVRLSLSEFLAPVRSGAGFEGEGVAVGVLKPRYASTASACGHSLGVVPEIVVTDELDAAGRQLINDPIDVIDVLPSPRDRTPSDRGG